MTKKFSGVKVFLVAASCGGIPFVTAASCDSYYGAFDFFRNDDSGDYYDDGYYYDDPYYFDPYCDPFYCY